MTASDWEIYQSFPELAGDGTIDLDGDTFKCLLLTSSYSPAVSTQDELADISSAEHASSNGYARVTLTNVTWTKSGANTTLSCDPIVFTASGGSIVARYAAIFDDTATGDKLVCYCLLDDTPADVTITDGNTLTITPDGTTGLVQYQIPA